MCKKWCPGFNPYEAGLYFFMSRKYLTWYDAGSIDSENVRSPVRLAVL